VVNGIRQRGKGGPEMKSRGLLWIATIIGVVLVVASDVSQGLQLKNEKTTLESRVAGLENRVASLEKRIIEMEEQTAHPPVKIVPCK
jgi:uncharacterized coiled-coil protein SlyX